MNELILLLHNNCPRCAKAAAYNADLGNPYFPLYISDEESLPAVVHKALVKLGQSVAMPLIINKVGNKIFVNEVPSYDDGETLKGFIQEFAKTSSAFEPEINSEVDLL
ncbi:MAG: hypothetical protein QW478_05010 [Candidatus Micrarchaeaceae archaeon]